MPTYTYVKLPRYGSFRKVKTEWQPDPLKIEVDLNGDLETVIYRLTNLANQYADNDRITLSVDNHY